MQIFISHITEESSLATCFKHWIEKLFLGHFEVFVSSDEESIRLGRRWIDEISASLDDCKIILILCSPTSISRPWISFEAGCGWIKEIPVIPICHSGLKLSSLQAPLSFLQGLDLADDSFMDKLLTNLAKELGVKVAPPIHPDMLIQLKEVESSIIKSADSKPSPKVAVREATVPIEEFDLMDNMNILDKWFMSMSVRDREGTFSFAGVDHALGLPPGTSKQLLKAVAAKRSYAVFNEGANTIVFKFSTSDKWKAFT